MDSADQQQTLWLDTSAGGGTLAFAARRPCPVPAVQTAGATDVLQAMNPRVRAEQASAPTCHTKK
jgi:hypothetical protein